MFEGAVVYYRQKSSTQQRQQNNCLPKIWGGNWAMHDTRLLLRKLVFKLNIVILNYNLTTITLMLSSLPSRKE
jgi:hypothetical protein